MNLARQHFLQSVEAIKIGKNLKLPEQKVINLNKKNPKFKTIFLDLDETLIHCDEATNNYTIKLNFPVEGGSVISVNFEFILGWNQSTTLLSVIFGITFILCWNYHIYSFFSIICRCCPGLFGPEEEIFFPSSLPAALHIIEGLLY